MPKNTENLFLNRRHFLASASMTGLAGTGILSSLSQVANAQARSGDYKALVCILLAGGCDSFNLLMPSGGAAHKAYQHARTNLALDAGSAHKIRDARSGDTFGLHPATRSLQTLFEEKRLSFIANIGTLVEPTNKDQYLSGGAVLPKGLLSHKDQIPHWQTSMPQHRGAKGVAGRLHDLNAGSGEISRNISLSGTNVFQYAKDTSAYAITNEGSVGLDVFDSTKADYQFVRRGIETVLNNTANDPYKSYYSDTIFAAHENHQVFQRALAASTRVKTRFPESTFGRDLRMIANTIAARQALNAPQQVFFVNYGGWDHHDGVLAKQNEMLKDVADSLAAFDRALQSIELGDAVTTFTISDFGRTLTSNGNGSDHGWGGNIMVMGGGIAGGQVHGQYPDLTLGNDLDIGSGIFIPTLPTDALYASLGRWLGVNDSDLVRVLPNLNRFPDTMQRIDLFG